MSATVPLVANKTENSLTSANRTRSLDLNSFNQTDYSSDNATAAFRVGDVLLSHGDSYTGSLLGNMPEGSGKYVWSDGCIYDGEWWRGMRHGVGYMRWPSAAVYEGEFSSDYMHGTGTYVGREDIRYRGRWRLNLKHGLGCQTYPNGDLFDGSWIQGTIDGPGKYVWANGNVYLGNMKGGKMSGKGTLTWTNGDSYEGSWLDGMMHGFGVYAWYDGGRYVGTWTRGLKDGKGAYYPNGSRLPAAQQLYLNALRKRGLLPDLRKKPSASHIRHASSVDLPNVKIVDNPGSRRVSADKAPKGNLMNLEQSQTRNVSLDRRWSLEVAIEKVLGYDLSLNSGDSILEGSDKDDDENAPILEREYMQGVLISELVLNNSFSSSSRRARRKQKKLAKEIKRPGETIIKGHMSYDLMLSLQLGIRQIEIDSKFLETQHIMDYSLLLGVHYRPPQHLRSLTSYQRSITVDRLAVLVEDAQEEDEISHYPQGLVLVPRGTDNESVAVGPHIRGSRLRASAVGDEEVDLLLPGTASRLQIQLGVNMPARV